MWTYMPSEGLVMSLWEPVFLVDSRIPYGAAIKKDHGGKKQKAITQKLSTH